jgi:hypothetical protein
MAGAGRRRSQEREDGCVRASVAGQTSPTDTTLRNDRHDALQYEPVRSSGRRSHAGASLNDVSTGPSNRSGSMSGGNAQNDHGHANTRRMQSATGSSVSGQSHSSSRNDSRNNGQNNCVGAAGGVRNNFNNRETGPGVHEHGNNSGHTSGPRYR